MERVVEFPAMPDICRKEELTVNVTARNSKTKLLALIVLVETEVYTRMRNLKPNLQDLLV